MSFMTFRGWMRESYNNNKIKINKGSLTQGFASALTVSGTADGDHHPGNSGIRKLTTVIEPVK
jgi:hypothetical protein